MKKFSLCVLFLLCFSAVSCSWLENDPVKIKYEVTGTISSVNIAMHNTGGNVEELTGVSIPWNKQFDVKNDCNYPYFAYISAQSNDSSGSVVAKIYKNGNLFQMATNNGVYVTAIASGMVVEECSGY
jgi:precorrin-6B methylase 1